MLLLLAVALVLAGLVLLIAGFVQDSMSVVYMSIACAAAGGMAVILFGRLARVRAVSLAAEGIPAATVTASPLLISPEATPAAAPDRVAVASPRRSSEAAGHVATASARSASSNVKKATTAGPAAASKNPAQNHATAKSAASGTAASKLVTGKATPTKKAAAKTITAPPSKTAQPARKLAAKKPGTPATTRPRKQS